MAQIFVFRELVVVFYELGEEGSRDGRFVLLKVRDKQSLDFFNHQILVGLVSRADFSQD